METSTGILPDSEYTSKSCFAIGEAWASLYRKYRQPCLAWELVVFFRKFLLVGSVVLLNLYPFRAVTVFLCTLAAALFLNTKYHPWEDLENNALENLVLMTLAAIAFSGVLVFAQTVYANRYVEFWMQTVATIVDVILFAAVAVFVVAVVVIVIVVVIVAIVVVVVVVVVVVDIICLRSGRLPGCYTKQQTYAVYHFVSGERSRRRRRFSAATHCSRWIAMRCLATHYDTKVAC